MNKSLLELLLAICLVAPAAQSQLAFNKVYNEVRIDQKLNAQVPLDLVFRDERGDTVRLGDYFHAKPVVLSFVYYQCPMLCTQVLNGMVDGFKGLNLSVGNEFDVVTVSIDPRDTPELAAEKKEAYLQAYGRPGAEEGWHFLTGQEPSIRPLADAVGFRYMYDETSGQFAHAAGIMVATPEGRIARYFYGIEYSPRDLRFALIDASQNKIGSLVDKLLLLCYHYDPMTGKYGPIITNIFRAGGALTVLVVGGSLFMFFRRERRRAAQGPRI